MIDRGSNIPYYCQLMEIVRQQISTSLLRAGQQIPSELEMSGIYGINRHTVRQAITELCRQGILYKIKGHGTYVAKSPMDLLEYRLSPKNRFTENIRQSGKQPSSKLLKWEEITAPAHIIEALALSVEERVYMLSILRYIDHHPFLFSKVFLPVKLLPCLPEYLSEFRSLSDTLEQCGVLMERVKTLFRASYPNLEEALALDIPGNLPMLKVENLLKKQDGVLIAYNIACYRGDIAKLSVDWEN